MSLILIVQKLLQKLQKHLIRLFLGKATHWGSQIPAFPGQTVMRPLLIASSSLALDFDLLTYWSLLISCKLLLLFKSCCCCCCWSLLLLLVVRLLDWCLDLPLSCSCWCCWGAGCSLEGETTWVLLICWCPQPHWCCWDCLLLETGGLEVQPRFDHWHNFFLFAFVKILICQKDKSISTHYFRLLFDSFQQLNSY